MCSCTPPLTEVVMKARFKLKSRRLRPSRLADWESTTNVNACVFVIVTSCLIMCSTSASTLSFVHPYLPVQKSESVFTSPSYPYCSTRSLSTRLSSGKEEGDQPPAASPPPVKRGRGRPKGSVNKPSTSRPTSGRGRGAGRGTAGRTRKRGGGNGAGRGAEHKTGGDRSRAVRVDDADSSELRETRRVSGRTDDNDIVDDVSTSRNFDATTVREQQQSREKSYQTQDLLVGDVPAASGKALGSAKRDTVNGADGKTNILESNSASEGKLGAVNEVMLRVDELIDMEYSADYYEERSNEDFTEDDISRQRAEEILADPSLRHVMVVFGKHLIRDQVTIEYASRLRRLVHGIKSGRLKPVLVCFTGGQVRDNHVADAEAGYIFFRHLCDHQHVDISELHFVVESQSTCTKEAMWNVVKEIERLEAEDRFAVQEQDGRPKVWPTTKYHFTLISNEYHLHRMDVVHRLSPIVSLLAPLEQLGASWGYEHVPYPYQCCDDEGKRFQSEVYKTLEELIPVQVNVQAVANCEEFFQEENFVSLCNVRRKLIDFIRQLQSSRGPLALHMHMVDMQRAAEQGRRGKKGTSPAGSVANMRLDEALEWAAGALGKIEEIIEPAATRRDSVSLRAWAMVAALIEKAVLQGRKTADPDKPLKASEWSVPEEDTPQIHSSCNALTVATSSVPRPGRARQARGSSANSIGSEQMVPLGRVYLEDERYDGYDDEEDYEDDYEFEDDGGYDEEKGDEAFRDDERSRKYPQAEYDREDEEYEDDDGEDEDDEEAEEDDREGVEQAEQSMQARNLKEVVFDKPWMPLHDGGGIEDEQDVTVLDTRAPGELEREGGQAKMEVDSVLSGRRDLDVSRTKGSAELRRRRPAGTMRRESTWVEVDSQDRRVGQAQEQKQASPRPSARTPRLSSSRKLTREPEESPSSPGTTQADSAVSRKQRQKRLRLKSKTTVSFRDIGDDA